MKRLLLTLMLTFSILFIYSQVKPLAKQFRVTEEYLWDANKLDFSITYTEFTKNPFITILPDSNSVEFKYIVDNQTITINTEIINFLERETEKGVLTILFLKDNESYPYILEYCGDDYAFYYKYDVPETGYNGFHRADKLEEVKY